MKGIRKNREGAASFYIVAFSTLVLVVIAASFAMSVIAEVARTSNDELSQSAYDSAMAGVEDAKLAYSNYQRCLKKGATATAPNGDTTITCNEIVWWMEHPDCYMVGHILGRIPEKEEKEVSLSDMVGASSRSNTNQAYTCVKISTSLSDYRSTITSSTQVKIVKASFSGGITAANIKGIKFSWYSNRPDVSNNYTSSVSGRVAFRSPLEVTSPIPSVVELQIVQTGGTFNISDFDISNGDKTNRATAFLVPTSNSTLAATTNDYQVGTYASNKNTISASSLAKTNDHTTANKPFSVYCPNNATSEFACSVELNLPSPVSGTRNNETFMILVALPYGQPDTDFAVEFICSDASSCPATTNSGVATVSGQATVKDAQVSIDSTGRANDLYRRVETRMESDSSSFPFPYYAVQALGSGSGNNAPVFKNLSTTYENRYGGLYR